MSYRYQGLRKSPVIDVVLTGSILQLKAYTQSIQDGKSEDDMNSLIACLIDYGLGNNFVQLKHEDDVEIDEVDADGYFAYFATAFKMLNAQFPHLLQSASFTEVLNRCDMRLLLNGSFKSLSEDNVCVMLTNGGMYKASGFDNPVEGIAIDFIAKYLPSFDVNALNDQDISLPALSLALTQDTSVMDYLRKYHVNPELTHGNHGSFYAFINHDAKLKEIYAAFDFLNEQLSVPIDVDTNIAPYSLRNKGQSFNGFSAYFDFIVDRKLSGNYLARDGSFKDERYKKMKSILTGAQAEYEALSNVKKERKAKFF